MACSDADYAFLRELVLNQSANLIDPSRNALFETRLTPVVQLAGAPNLEGLVGLLREKRPAHLHRAVAEAMTISETSFFRDFHPFEALRSNIIPRLVEQKQDQRRLRIWSAASSTGQEAYSLAMMLCEHFPELSRWDVKVLGTDISEPVLSYARRARYRRLEINRGLPARMLVKYFKRHGDEWEVLPAIRAMCDFSHANLCAPFPVLPKFDLVLLRNVLLYFPRQNRTGVFRSVAEQMSQTGYLVLGNAEQAEDSTMLFQAQFATNCYFYRRVSAT